MRTENVFLCVATLALAASTAFSQEPDAKALDAALERYVKLYNEHQAEELSMQYAENINVIYTDGKQLSSRKEMKASLEEFFSKNPNVSTKFSDIKRQVLAPDLVVEDGVWEESGHTEKGLPTLGRYTSILKRINGKWLLIHDRAWVDPVSK